MVGTPMSQLYCCTMDVVSRDLTPRHEVRYPETRKRLLELMREDQEDRLSGRFWGDPANPDAKLLDELIERDNARATEMLELLEQIKTPSERNVGLDGSRAIWLIAVHNMSHDIQRLVLKKMSRLYYKDKSQVFYPGIPYIVDVLTIESSLRAEDCRQLYGTRAYYDKDGSTQFFTILHPEKLNERRKKYGLGPYRNPDCTHHYYDRTEENK